MADTKLSALPALLGANVQTSTDIVYMVQTSTTASKKMLFDELRIALLSNTALTNSLGSDVALNNQSNYFDGPSISQGTVGTWFVSGTISLTDTAGLAQVHAKLWDGTSIIASAIVTIPAINQFSFISLSGYITSPAGNLRISAKDTTSSSGVIKFNATANSKDSTIYAVRIG